MDELVSGGPEERFELGLDVILRGLASYARALSLPCPPQVAEQGALDQ